MDSDNMSSDGHSSWADDDIEDEGETEACFQSLFSSTKFLDLQSAIQHDRQATGFDWNGFREKASHSFLDAMIRNVNLVAYGNYVLHQGEFSRFKRIVISLPCIFVKLYRQFERTCSLRPRGRQQRHIQWSLQHVVMATLDVADSVFHVQSYIVDASIASVTLCETYSNEINEH